MTTPLPLIVLVGPTAVGKTDVAVRLATRFTGAEIVSADSRQIYRYMNVGTAKPDAEQLRVRHHLLDIRDPDEEYSAGDFAEDARAAIREIRARGAVPLVVGGAGLYVQALVDGLVPVRGNRLAQVRERIRNRLAEAGWETLYQDLLRLDPAAARRVAPQDVRRVTRALERVELGARRTGSWALGNSHGEPPRVLWFGLLRDRESLYGHIDRRAELMLKQGLVEEVADLLERGYAPDSPGLRTLGYAEAVEFLQGDLDEADLLGRIQRRTRRYAKRQLTWYGRERRLRWIDLDVQGPEGAVRRILAQIRAETANNRAGGTPPVDRGR